MKPKGWHRLRAQIFLTVKGASKRMTLGARGVLIDGSKVLLIKHTYVPGWQFPGGGVDPGETMQNAMEREVYEETGYRVTGNVELFGIYHNNHVTNRDHVALYTCRKFEMAQIFQANFEIAEMGWFDHKKLPNDMAMSASRRVAEIFGDSAQSPNW